MNSEKIAAAAVRWIGLRDRARELSEERGGIECVEESAWHGSVLIGPNRQEKPAPCWKRFEQYGKLPPRDEWCPHCLKRQALHDELRRVSRLRGAALRTLIRYARQTMAVQQREEE